MNIKRTSTHFLRAGIILLGLVALLFCVFVVPANDIGVEFPNLAYLHYPMMIGMWLAAVPFFMMLYHGWALLGVIDKNTAFSEFSVKRLNNIKYCAIAIGIIYAALVPVVFYPIAQADDAPGIIIGGMVIAAMPFVFAVFVAVLKRLLENAIALKYENDLTV